jgi:3-oxoacyl-[acyl-carrier protein] reductase
MLMIVSTNRFVLMSMSNLPLVGAHALITGASGAIGSAIARHLHQAGAHVHLAARRVSVLESLQEEFGSDRCSVWPLDLAELSSIEQLFRDMKQANIPLNILVNNGGVTRDALILRMQTEDWDTVLATNLTSCFHLCRGVYSGFSKAPQGYARIINIASVVGSTGNPGQVNYAASKAGMVGLTKTLALEWSKRPITVNAVAPGFIQSDMTANLQVDKVLERIPCGRMGSPDDIAFAVAFLANPQASYITGQTLHVNGGMALF